MAVMIGIDPHKGSHTAVAIGPSEEPLGRQRVRACPGQAWQLLAWAAAWPERTWAVEGATGRGRMLAQAEAMALKDYPWIPVRFRTTQNLVQTYVKGWVDNGRDMHRTRWLWLAPRSR